MTTTIKITFFFLLFSSISSFGQSTKFIGKWQTPDKAVLEFYACGSVVCAKQISAEKEADKKANGMQIAKDLIQDKEKVNVMNGTVIDPSNGKTYKGVFTLSDDGKSVNLKVKWGFINFNEKWVKL